MKDAHDQRTAEMLPTPPRRGRPPTGQAKTAAQRKREQREKDRMRPVEEWTMETLLQAIATATQAGDVQRLAAGCAELKRRAELRAQVLDAADPVDAFCDLLETDFNTAFGIAQDIQARRTINAG